MDLTFDNTNIQAFFDGDDSAIPVSELLYLHSHPLVRPNFIIELETLVLKAGEEMKRRNMKGKLVDEFIRISVAIGSLLPEITKDNAPFILKEMRNTYQLCKRILPTSA